MVKISKNEHEQHRKETASQAKNRVLVEIGEKISQALSGLTDVLKISKADDSKLIGAIGELTAEMKKSNSSKPVDKPPTIINEFPKALGDKIDKLSDTIKNKPDSFEFDIKRDDGGNIDKVLVKPVRK